MTSMQIDLPDQLSSELQRLVDAGLFATEQEIVRLALLEFLRRNQATLTEQFQREDIAWAVAQAPSNPSVPPN